MMIPNPSKVVVGKMTHGTYEHADVKELVGKTIEAVYVAEVNSSYVSQPLIVLLFTDGTFHGFVHPGED